MKSIKILLAAIFLLLLGFGLLHLWGNSWLGYVGLVLLPVSCIVFVEGLLKAD